MAVKFTLEFNVETSNGGDYQDFIQSLRRQLQVRFSHDRPVLAVQQKKEEKEKKEKNPPALFFDLVLRTNDHHVRFRFRLDNLYLIGYQMENGQWLEFNNNENQYLITEPQTTFIGFKGSYHELARSAHRRIEEIRVGVHNLLFAINQLAVTTNDKARARSLIIVIMTICESTRLIPVSNHVAYSFDNRPGTTRDTESLIEPWIMDLVHSWRVLSAALLLTDAYPEKSFQLRENNLRIPPDNKEIRTIPEAAEVLGILLGRRFNGPRRCVNGLRRSLLSVHNEEGQPFLGLPLLEVFTVRINNIDNEDPWELYGTITTNNGLYTQYIYNRTRDNYESISASQNATLSGPLESVSAFGNFTIKLILTDKDIISGDNEIINQDISWDVANTGNAYDELISRQLDSNIGSVTVNYAVLRNAVSAKVTVTLKEGADSTNNVYGHVSACYEDWENPETTCLLFDRTSENYVEVRRGDDIPLLRSVIAVPLNKSLKVTARLYDYDRISADDVIANETLKFPVTEIIPSTNFKDFHGEDRNWVQVIINWSSGF
ncbi:uncharacterized protein LOC129309233 [Prosopis cineraria]|uniref:uncharacterized protein LOC129309233 n=1 Tax=Prosopis cineraria TaxID=364024 RepID=UPI00240F43BF|nr:uncharacterized protein LOC129309233 [Prosopis cineraria]